MPVNKLRNISRFTNERCPSANISPNFAALCVKISVIALFSSPFLSKKGALVGACFGAVLGSQLAIKLEQSGTLPALCREEVTGSDLVLCGGAVGLLAGGIWGGAKEFLDKRFTRIPYYADPLVGVISAVAFSCLLEKDVLFSTGVGAYLGILSCFSRVVCDHSDLISDSVRRLVTAR